jgi:hypothetical protein
MPRARMRSIDGWIDELLAEFRVNTAVAREKARLRKYDVSKDKSVDHYYYEKLDLVRTAEAGISDRRTVEELWLGLPADFQALLDYEEMVRKSVPNFGHALRMKDLSYRAMKERRRDEYGGASREGGRRSDGKDDCRRDRDGRFGKSDYTKKDESRYSGTKDVKDGSRDREKRRENRGKDDHPPAQLPRDKWRKDDKGRMMKRKCRFCNKWHMDFDCPTRPASYSLSAALQDQWHSSDGAEPNSDSDPDSSGSSTDSDGTPEPQDGRRWRPAKDITRTYHNVYSTAIPDETKEIKLPNASHLRIEELPVAFSVGTGVSYLSAQPCPVKAWVGVQPSASRPLSTGVVDSGGPSIIARRLVPNSYTILGSPMKPVFARIGNSKTPACGYVVLPLHLPNTAALSGDERSAWVAKMWVEFQVVEECPAGFLVGVDSISAYKMAIDYQKSVVHLNSFDPPLKIPITDGARFSPKHIDPRIYAAEPINIRPYSEVWVPVRFTALREQTHLFVTPVRHANVAEGTYATCSYAVMASDTSHLLMVNPSPRPVRIRRDDLVGMYEPFTPNSPFSFFGATSTGVFQPATLPTTPNPAPAACALSTTARLDVPGNTVSSHFGNVDDKKIPLFDGPLRDVAPTLGLDDPDLSWHDGVDVPIDPFGLMNEFRDTGPLQVPSEGRRKEPDDGEDLGASRGERRAKLRAKEKELCREERQGRKAGAGNGSVPVLRASLDLETKDEGSSSGSPDEIEGKQKVRWDICPDLSRRERREWKKMLDVMPHSS